MTDTQYAEVYTKRDLNSLTVEWHGDPLLPIAITGEVLGEPLVQQFVAFWQLREIRTEDGDIHVFQSDLSPKEDYFVPVVD